MRKLNDGKPSLHATYSGAVKQGYPAPTRARVYQNQHPAIRTISGQAMTRTGTVSKDLEILPGKSLDLTPWVVRIYALTQLRRALLELILLAGGVKALGVNWSVHSLCKRYRFGGFLLTSPVCLISIPTLLPRPTRSTPFIGPMPSGLVRLG